jgi:hypothetical protein
MSRHTLLCDFQKKPSQSNGAERQTIEAAPAEQQDGSSFVKAIIIRENSMRNGIRAEYAWIRERYPESKEVFIRLSGLVSKEDDGTSN